MATKVFCPIVCRVYVSEKPTLGQQLPEPATEAYRAEDDAWAHVVRAMAAEVSVVVADTVCGEPREDEISAAVDREAEASLAEFVSAWKQETYATSGRIYSRVLDEAIVYESCDYELRLSSRMYASLPLFAEYLLEVKEPARALSAWEDVVVDVFTNRAQPTEQAFLDIALFSVSRCDVL